jgi:pSer/pThr/pTyr-binding forkhead associated (FHA) protein
MQLSTVIMLVIICIAFVVMALVFYRIGRRAGLQLPNALTMDIDGVAAVEPQRADTDIDLAIAEYLLDGTDDKGIRYKVRVPDRQLRTEAGIIIGRNPQGSPYIINHADVSRKHARMRMMQDRIFIEDLDSTNGTSVNGQSIDNKGPTSVIVGDQIIIGSVVLKLQIVGA